MSYRRKHIQKKLANSKPKIPPYKKAIFWYFLLFLVLIITTIYFLLFYDKIQIKNISVFGTASVNAQDLKNVVEKNITKNFINFGNWSLSSKSIFLLKTDELKKSILNSNATIETVNLDKKWPNELIVQIKEREQIAVFCQSNECFEIDANGIIFEKTYENGNNLIVRQNESIDNLFVGKTVVYNNIMLMIYDIEKNLKDNFQINLTEALISTPIRLDITTGEGWQIYFDIDNEANIIEQITKLNLLLQKEIPVESRLNLQYIDLRFSKAYYK